MARRLGDLGRSAACGRAWSEPARQAAFTGLLAWHGCCASQLLRCQLCVLIAGMSCLRLRLLYHAGLSLTAQQRPGSRQHLNLTRMHTSMQPGIIQGFSDQDLQLAVSRASHSNQLQGSACSPGSQWLAQCSWALLCYCCISKCLPQHPLRQQEGTIWLNA